jgi:hypothetical protein
MLTARRKLAVAATVLGIAGVVVANPAAAQPGSITIQGTGTIDPGTQLTVPLDQSFSFDGTAVVLASPGAGIYSCSFAGNSNGPETSVQGAGVGSGSCSNATASATADFTYTRVGTVVTIIGTVAGDISGTVRCVLGFVPTSNPTTSFRVAGECVLV